MKAPRAALPDDVRDPGFTPGARHFAALFEQLASPEAPTADAALAALGRVAEDAAPLALDRLERAGAPERARLIALLGRAARSRPEYRATLLRELGESEPKARRTAIIALGKCGGEGVEAALIAAFARSALPEQRALVDALGKIGGAVARDFVASIGSDDPELERLRRRSLAMLERTLARAERSEIALDVPLGHAFPVVVRCRRGLGPVLADEARELGWSLVRATHAEIALSWSGPLAPLLVARTALDVGVEVPLPAGGAIDERVSKALAGELAASVFAAWTRGRARFRLSFAAGGRRRAQVWRIASRSSESGGPLNDPTRAVWSAEVDERRARLLLIPRGAPDTRFSYRVSDVRAASHPTLAAALARVAGARADDWVWDPFVGSGLELVERARRGPYRRMLGSDADPRALDAARRNLAAAGVEAELVRADARSYRPGAVTLVVTNPPMGRRVARDGSLAPLLDAFVDNVAAVLAPGGRLVWLTPDPERSARRLATHGLAVAAKGAIDLGGFDAELMLASKRKVRA